MYRIIDLFAGVGGIRLGFEQTGRVKCVYSCEIDKFAAKTYMANFGDNPLGDITQVDANDIPDHDILLAGFPCQPFSISGLNTKRFLNMATGFQDKTKGTMFFEVCRVLKAKRPKAFLLENVKGLTGHDKGRTFKVILDALEELDYAVFYQVIGGEGFVPQRRERIFLVGFDRQRYGRDLNFQFVLHPKNPKPVVRDILEDHVDDKYTLRDKTWSWMQKHKAKHAARGNMYGYVFAPLDGISRTISARYWKDGVDSLVEQPGKNPRKFTPRECARLLGFPDSFKFPVSDTQAYKQCGNSVVVPLVKNIAELMVVKLDALENKNEKGTKTEVSRNYDHAALNQLLRYDIGSEDELFDIDDEYERTRKQETQHYPRGRRPVQEGEEVS